MISVVIPAYNEEDAIGDTINEIAAALKGASMSDYEIIVVDDGSTDQTRSIAQASGAQVIGKLENIGYGHSLKNGILAAKHDTIVIIDADGTYSAGDIPALVRKHLEGFHMVVGARSGKEYRESIIKAPLRTILKWLVEFTAGRRIPDVNSGLRAFSRHDVLPLFDHLSDSFSFTTSMTLAYMLKKRYVCYLPTAYNKRIGKTKVRLFRDSLRTIQYIIQAILYYNPLKIYIVLCLFAVAVGIVGMAVGFLLSTTAVVLLGAYGILVAVLVFALGLIADLLSQILSGIERK